jgi:hypothetical protein
MSYTDDESICGERCNGYTEAPTKGEIGAAFYVVGLSAARAAKESRSRDDMIRVAHRAGASARQLADVSGLGRKTVTAIVSHNSGVPD